MQTIYFVWVQGSKTPNPRSGGPVHDFPNDITRSWSIGLHPLGPSVMLTFYFFLHGHNVPTEWAAISDLEKSGILPGTLYRVRRTEGLSQTRLLFY